MSQFYDFLRNDLKQIGPGKTTHIALRTALQVVEPDSDQLTRQILPLLKKCIPEFKGTFLDVGCYGGWVYPYVRDAVDYHGIDKWPDAVEAGTLLFGNRFTCCDVMDYQTQHDIVWCSQIVDSSHLWDKLRTLAKKLLILAAPGVHEMNGCTEFYYSDRNGVAVWRG